jgi:hypothetical protein
MKMDHRRNPETAVIAKARALLAAAVRSVNQLESAAEQAFDCLAALTGQWCPCHHSASDPEQGLHRLAALTGMLSQFEEPAGLHDPLAADVAAMFAPAVCQDAQALLRVLDAIGKRLAVVTVFVQQVAAMPSAD